MYLFLIKLRYFLSTKTSEDMCFCCLLLDCCSSFNEFEPPAINICAWWYLTREGHSRTSQISYLPLSVRTVYGSWKLTNRLWYKQATSLWRYVLANSWVCCFHRVLQHVKPIRFVYNWYLISDIRWRNIRKISHVNILYIWSTILSDRNRNKKWIEFCEKWIIYIFDIKTSN